MKCLCACRSSPGGGIVAAILAAGLIFGPTIASAYVDEDLFVNNGDGVWTITPSGDRERDADTLRHVIDLAAEGDIINLVAGTFDFSPGLFGDPDDERSITLDKGVKIIGEFSKDPQGRIKKFHSVFKGSRRPFVIRSRDVRLEGILVELADGGEHCYAPPMRPVGVMLNMSVRLALHHGEVAIPGLVLSGGRQLVMFRAVGPALGVFGVENAVSDPIIELYKDGEMIARNCDWCACKDQGTAARMICSRVGAFPLPEGSSDAVIVKTLDPGAYTVMIKDEDGFSGAILFEMYTVPSY